MTGNMTSHGGSCAMQTISSTRVMSPAAGTPTTIMPIPPRKDWIREMPRTPTATEVTVAELSCRKPSALSPTSLENRMCIPLPMVSAFARNAAAIRMEMMNPSALTPIPMTLLTTPPTAFLTVS